jgi:predicted RNA-binding protein
MNIVDFKKYPFTYNGTALRSFASRGRKERWLIKNAPLSQVPFLIYFGHDVERETIRKDIDYGLWTIYSIEEILEWIKRAQENNCLRDLIEMFASFTPICSDILMQADLSGITKDKLTNKTVMSSFHSYNRSYVRELLDKMCNFKTDKKKCLLLPCSAKRPYNVSKTHQEIYGSVVNNIFPYPLEDYHKVVITTIGVVPEEFWNDPFVLSYTNSYPDLWQVYLRCKQYFSINKYEVFRNFHRYVPFLEIIKLCDIDILTEAEKTKDII